MMKPIYKAIRQKMNGKSEQDRLLEYVSNRDTVEKAVEGSMSKRIEVFHKAGYKKSSV